MSDIVSDVNTFSEPVCNNCQHYEGFGVCKAFLDIPDDIIDGKNNHSKIIKGQIGDFIFKKIKDE